MAVAHVQTVEHDAGSGQASVAVIPASLGAGNALIVCVGWGSSSGTEALSSLADTQGNTFTEIGTGQFDSTDSWLQRFYYAKNVTGGADTVTATFTASRNFPMIVVSEFSGVDTTTPLDVSSFSARTAGSATTDAMTSGAQTVADGDGVWGIMTNVSGLGPTVSVGTGFTSRLANTTFGVWAESLIKSGSGSQAATFTLGSASGQWLISMVALKAAGGTTFNDSGSGTLTFSGSGVESASAADSGSGTVTFSGSGVESASYADTGSGTVTFSGSGTESYSNASIHTLTDLDPDTGTLTVAPAATTGTLTDLDPSTGTLTAA